MHDRFAPEAHEDFLCYGKSAREVREIRDRLARDEAHRESEHADDLAHAEERAAAEAETDFALAADYANKAIAADGYWAPFFHGLSRFYWSRFTFTS